MNIAAHRVGFAGTVRLRDARSRAAPGPSCAGAGKANLEQRRLSGRFESEMHVAARQTPKGATGWRYRALAALLILVFPAGAGAEVPVRVERVTSRAIVQQVDIIGTVTSPRTALLSAAVAGLVAELHVDEGRRVETGDALLELDAELARLALERAQAEVRQRETAVADAKRRLAQAERVGTERGIARTEIESLRAEVSIDEAALAASEAAVREQRALVARHTLKAPFPGVVSERYTELGEWVNPGDGLMELVETDNLRFDFRVGQDLFATLAPDTPIEITLDALPERSFRGHVSTIVPVKNPSARTFLVRVPATAAETNGRARITPGMSARGRLSIDAGRSGIVVPRDAILRFPDGRITVWVVEMDAELPVVRERSVNTGLEFDSVVEILGGLDDGDMVVVRGNETLQEDQAVTILDGTR